MAALARNALANIYEERNRGRVNLAESVTERVRHRQRQTERTRERRCERERENGKERAHTEHLRFYFLSQAKMRRFDINCAFRASVRFVNAKVNTNDILL